LKVTGVAFAGGSCWWWWWGIGATNRGNCGSSKGNKGKSGDEFELHVEFGLDYMNDVGCSSKENTTKLLSLLYSFEHRELI